MQCEDIFDINGILAILEKVSKFQMEKFGNVTIDYKAANELVTEADIDEALEQISQLAKELS